MDKINVLVILGTTRPNNRTSSAANLIYSVGKSLNEVEVDLIDIKELNITDDGNTKDPNYTKLTKWADAFFIVTPEYNHGVPGGLKRVLDSEYDLYNHKAVALAGVSSGPFGGARGIESLVPIVRELGLVVTRTDVYFPNVKKMFDKKGNLVDKQHIERIEKPYNELIFIARCLKWGREERE
jgi:NAD(P)H-dependent FMN reductase